MATMDRDTFIPLGTSIVKLLLIASGQGALATAVGEGAGLLAKFRRTLEIGGNRAVFAEKIADDAAKQLLREHQGISEADWHVAARQVASLIDQLSEKERLAAGYNWEELRRTLLDLGGTDLRSDLADESARQAFDWVLEVACQRIADCFTEKEALASIFDSVEEVRAGIQRLADRPAGASQTRAVVADHLEVVRDLAPDPLEDRERELAELETFVRGSQDTWYAMEAGMISGKTALMSSFTLNPPSDVHIVSFFNRRMGGDGNDWRSFSFVAGAQLAEILGDEYTERVSEPASQNTEFRQLLRRAATACQSDKKPRPLVLVIDGVDEDSYYEDPDAPGAKSILSLLPRHLPEGVKLVTASRPNPRMPEDIVCNASRVVVSLKPSPIAQEKINQKDIETFFKSDLAVDIGAFLAACGGSLTVDELRQLIARRRGLDNVPSRDVKACVDHSPGRMLMRVNVGFGDRPIPSYTLGHDAVLRAVLREISPDSFGEDGWEDEVWWAQVRKKSLGPYRKIIQQWVMVRAGKGWGRATPDYMLSDACFDLMLSDEANRGAIVKVMLDGCRYNEMLRRYGRKSLVLGVIERECVQLIEKSHGECFDDAMTEPILCATEVRERIAKFSRYIKQLPTVSVLYFVDAPDLVLDMVMAIDDRRDRLKAAKEVVETTVNFGCERSYLSVIPTVLNSELSYQDRHSENMFLLVDILVLVVAELGCNIDTDLKDQIVEVVASVLLKSRLLGVFSRFGNIDALDEGSYVDVSIMLAAGCVSEKIDDPGWRAKALTHVVIGLVSADRVDQALEVVERIDDPGWRAKALTHVVIGLVSADRVDQAFDVVERIDDPGWRAKALVRVAGALAQVGDNERARQVSENAADVAEQVDVPDWRAEILVRVAGILAQTGDIGRARQLAENVERLAEQVQRGVQRVAFLEGVVAVLVRRGLIGGVRIVPEIVTAVVEQVHDDFSRGYIIDRLVGGLVGAGHVDQAFDVVERIDDPGWRARALVRVAGALAQVGDNERARQVSENAADVAEQVDAPSWRAEVLGRVAAALAQAGDIQRARQIFETANVDDREIELYHRARSLVCIVDALTQMGDKERAREVVENIANEVERMKASAWRTQDQERVVDAYLRVGCFEKALGVAERMDDSWARCKALTSIVGWLSHMKRVAEALNVAKRIAVSRLYVKALVKVASALAGTADTDRAKSVAEDAVSAAEQIETPEARAIARKEALSALVWIDVDSVLELALKEPRVGVRAQILANVSESLVRAGNSDRAKSVAEDAVSAAELIEEIEVRTQILANVSESLVRAGNSDRAKSVAEDAVNSVRSCYDYETYLLVLEALIGVGAIEEALNVISIIKSPSFRSRAHSVVINYYVRCNSLVEAINALKSALAETERFSTRTEVQDYCSVLASACLDVLDHIDGSSAMRERWLGLARSVLARSWLYGASVWDSFDVLVRVAPELAVRLVDERILAEPEQGTAPESDPDLGPEGPGGDTGSYR